MIRRISRLAALCTGALILGTLLGAATNLPRVHIQSAYASQQKPDPNYKEPPPDPNKAAAGARCKVTKDCQQSLLCTKVGDHKECTVPPIDPLEAPAVT